MLTFVDHGRQFENDSLTNWKPMQILKLESFGRISMCICFSVVFVIIIKRKNLSVKKKDLNAANQSHKRKEIQIF